MQLYPLKFLPILQPRIWGGCNLAKLGKELPPHQPIGESWEVSDRPEAQSVIVNGPLAGKTLHWLWSNHLSLLTLHPSRCFPLLVKWLDCTDAVSVQVHPYDAKSGEPKNEAWYIVAANRDAKIWAGLKRGLSRADLVRALQNHSIEKCLRSFRPRVGEIVFIPAGCIHAARGVVLCEIQQNSDTTYRLSDWGRGRELQIERGLATIKFSAQPQRGKSATCPFFQVRTVSFHKPWSPPPEMTIVSIVKGAGEIHWSNGREPYRTGDCWLLPSDPICCRFESQRETSAVVTLV